LSVLLLAVLWLILSVPAALVVAAVMRDGHTGQP
jgi:hypothetical protein